VYGIGGNAELVSYGHPFPTGRYALAELSALAIRSGQMGIGHGALLIKFLPHSLFPIPY
jgi:hypothetical protein